jgi:polyvinyl alcohol dehydrogenase (cytochrome)
MYHHDAAHTGFDPSTTQLGTLAGSWSASLDGAVYAEPLALGSTIIVVTENDTIYALDAGTGTVSWSTHVATPAPLSLVRSLGGLPSYCGNIDPLGMTGTPVYDPASNEVFVAAEVNVNGTAVAHRLYGVDASSGQMLLNGVNGVSVDPPGLANVAPLQQRAALAIGNGRIYVAYGGLDGDCGNYHGYVVSVTEAGASPISFQVPSQNLGGIWGSSGPAVDAAGHVYVSVGNGDPNLPYDGTDSVLKLDGNTLAQTDYFAPTTWASDNANDLDLGSVGPALLNNGLLFQVGKQSTGFLLNTAALGGIGSGLASHTVCFALGGTAYVDPYVYVPCSDGIRAVRLTAGPDFTVAWHTAASANGPPIVAYGLVWSIDTNNGVLYGLNPTSGAVLVQTPVGPVNHFATPAADGNRLIVPTATGVQTFVNQFCAPTPAPSPPPGTDGPAVVRGNSWYFRSGLTTGPGQGSDCYGIPGDVPVSGDWDGNGTRTPGVFRAGVWYLSNSATSGVADTVVSLGNPGDIPVVGDWTGTGRTSIGVFRNGVWYLQAVPHTGTADFALAYGNPGDVPTPGDWGGGGRDSPGVFRNGVWYLATSLHGGIADVALNYGNPTDVPAAGHWGGHVTANLGVFRNGVWYVTTAGLHGGVADLSFDYGIAGDIPVSWR